MPQASPNFSFDELTRTDTGLGNEPTVEARDALVRLCVTILEPMRAKVGPLRVNSGFRSVEVNRRVGGVATSQHCNGEAADIYPVRVSPSVLFDLTAASDLPFHQLILEPGWVHVSIAPIGKTPKREVLKAHRISGGMRYEHV